MFEIQDELITILRDLPFCNFGLRVQTRLELGGLDGFIKENEDLLFSSEHGLQRAGGQGRKDADLAAKELLSPLRFDAVNTGFLEGVLDLLAFFNFAVAQIPLPLVFSIRCRIGDCKEA